MTVRKHRRRIRRTGSRPAALLGLLAVSLLAGAKPVTVQQWTVLTDRLRPLHRPLGKPQPGDWLSQHEEGGETFLEYARSRPVTPRGKRTVIYLQPLGDFTPTQRRLITLTADWLGRFYSRPVKIEQDWPLARIPADWRRRPSSIASRWSG